MMHLSASAAVSRYWHGSARWDTRVLLYTKMGVGVVKWELVPGDAGHFPPFQPPFGYSEFGYRQRCSPLL